MPTGHHRRRFACAGDDEDSQHEARAVSLRPDACSRGSHMKQLAARDGKEAVLDERGGLMKGFINRFSRRFVLLGAAALALAGSFAYASIPDSDGTIHACLLKSLEQVRIIGPSAQQWLSNGNNALWQVDGFALCATGS